MHTALNTVFPRIVSAESILFWILIYLMYCDLCSQYIQVRKLFKGGNYSREKTIWGNTVSQCDAIERKPFSDWMNEEMAKNLLDWSTQAQLWHQQLRYISHKQHLCNWFCWQKFPSKNKIVPEPKCPRLVLDSKSPLKNRKYWITDFILSLVEWKWSYCLN